MKTMRMLIGAAAAGLALTGVAAADEAKPTFSGNIALATDYTFRGISQTGENVAVQGGFDYSYGMFYAGTWGSNIDFGVPNDGIEIDVYAGVKPSLGPVGLDFGVIGYFYPNASESAVGLGELDYVELKGAATVAPAENISLTGSVFFSPEFTGETGQAIYVEGRGSAALNDTFSVSGGLGWQQIDDVNGIGAGSTEDSYTTWDIGGTVAAYGFSIDLRYVDTSLERNDPIIAQAFTTEERAEGRVMLKISRAL